ncbi:protein kinase [Pantoea sp. BL1]|uniref:protein kinase domain-containing protein n=1 Tax=Pantoea sp. BL1 TaxID=1628190 RepID=UPI0005F7F7A2|nr:protein kinase [Pantoea sp. BL1]KJV50155.1 protein kinase [Pantoea sp. BL1]
MNFYELDDSVKKVILRIEVGKQGEILDIKSGMCGDVYVFDHGAATSPRFTCAKIPKKSKNANEDEINSRFINELKNQLKYYHHQYVHWAFDFKEVMGVPVALFRYWGSDLREVINKQDQADIKKLSILAYLCSGLRHCYSKGLISHQDLKPENIFIRNMRNDFRDLPALDVYDFPLLGDFGLANAFIDSNHFCGARPYMAPEQWLNQHLSIKTDIFALGVILCELMSNGYHPVGIRLSDYWPKPIKGNSQKWKDKDAWENWSLNGSKIAQEIESKVDIEILELIRKMLSTSPECRPSLDEVLTALLDIISKYNSNSHAQTSFLIKYFDSQVSQESFEDQWPSLYHRWVKFEEKFGKNSNDSQTSLTI